MARPLKHDDWRILARVIRWLLRVDRERLDLEQYEEFLAVRSAFLDFTINLKELTKDLPPEESSDEESEAEATEEGQISESDDELIQTE